MSMLKQYNTGKWFGAYYTELINSLGIVGIGNSLVGLTVLWVVASQSVTRFLPWLSYSLFIVVVFAVVLAILPLLHYIFMYKAIQGFQSEQSYKHMNPFKTDMDKIRHDLNLIKKRLDIKDEVRWKNGHQSEEDSSI